RLVDQVVRVHADAVAADQAGAERQEVPFGAGRFQHGFGVHAQAREHAGEFVHQRDVDVALGVFDRLGGLGGADVRGQMRTGADDAPIQRINERGRLRRGAGGDLDDVRQAPARIAGIDTLRAVADEEIAVEHQPGYFLQYG